MANAVARNRLPNNWADFNGLMDHFLGSAAGPGIQAYYVPAGVWEDVDAYHVELDVPGVKRENVDLTFEKGTLRITTERKAPEDSRAGMVDERRYGKVTRTVALPESIDPDSIVASLNDGVLHVTVSKKPEAQPKRIQIQ